jgi:hypothetical protein
MVTAVRKFLIFLIVVLLMVAAIGGFLVATTPRQSAGIRYPLGARERTLIAQVPESAEGFAVIPNAAALDAKLRANPVSRSTIESWSARQPLPRPWMIGGADLLAWKSGKETRYFLRLDPLRATLVRTYIMASGNTGGTLLINVPATQPIDSATVSRIVDLTSKLPPGDALVVQRESSRGGFPPTGRPAVTSVQVGESDITLTSVADVGQASSRPEGSKPALQFPRSAILSATFTSPPRLINDLNRLFGAKVSSLLEDGGSIAVYGVDFRKLLPRPLVVIALPNDEQRRATVDSFSKSLRVAEAVGLVRLRTAEVGNTLVLSFDDSIDQYLKDAFDQPRDESGDWQLRIEPARLVPILREFGKSLGLRIVTPRLFRSARDLEQWIGGLEQAKTIEATDSVDSGRETLRVRITAK